MNDHKVDQETALNEFNRFVDAMDLDIDESRMDEEDRKSLDNVRSLFVRNVMSGHLVVDDKGQPVYTPRSGGDPITFYEPNGAALLAMDQKKKGHDVAKTYAVLAAITQLDVPRFSKMPMRDLKVCNAIMSLFLG